MLNKAASQGREWSGSLRGTLENSDSATSRFCKIQACFYVCNEHKVIEMEDQEGCTLRIVFANKNIK